ncbi:22933_t:CDS:2 [Dentiscutata erythropus]|uniref:Transcription initiation factor TFIID subunit 8 n=1 Tax=Dentiscutata erythropus TaxID=1348616 RepID=A0A9N9AXS8_9GLOM|nr:22933_t:CDS:2 [Dentiscutata erythropus]
MGDTQEQKKLNHDLPVSTSLEPWVSNEIDRRIGAFFAREAGFTSVTPSAYEALGNLLGLYLGNIIKTSRAYAELACRAQPNINDVEKSLKDWSVRTGALEDHMEKCRAKESYHAFASKFLSSLQPTSSAIESSTVFVPEDIILEGEEESFDGSHNNKRQRNSFTSSTHTFRPNYVPLYMPPFPSKHSYKKTPVYPKRHENDPVKFRESSLTQVKLVEKSLRRLAEYHEDPMDQTIIQLSIPDSPSSSSTVVSANSSPSDYDKSSISTSISTFDSAILHASTDKSNPITLNKSINNSLKKRKNVQASWEELND